MTQPAIRRGPRITRLATVFAALIAMTTPQTTASDAMIPTEPAPGTTRIEAVDTSGIFDRHTPEQVTIASNLNAWNPTADHANGVLTGPDGTTIGWYFDVKIPRSQPLLFKITRGSWETVEVSEQGGDIRDRRLTHEGTHTGGHTTRVTVHGFIDQRGSRWPELRPPTRPGEPTVTGDLRTFQHTSKILKNTRTVRIWLPPQYDAPENADRSYPVLYMHDGQNCFDAATAAFGAEWGADETATTLIADAEIPPMIIVAIDNAGAARSAEYNAPSANFSRHDNTPTATKPIGDKYLDMLTTELMPRIETDYRIATGPENTAIGGSSFGGNITLYAAMRHPGMFGAILAESPAIPVVGTRFFNEIKSHEGEWPDRVFTAMGTQETNNPLYNAELVKCMHELEAAFNDQGLTEKNGRLKVVIEEDARHFETDWARRLPDAFRYLFAPVDDEDASR